MQLRLLSVVVVVLLLVACGKSRIKEHKDWGTIFQKHGISNACIMIRDNNHEAIHFYNKDRCLTRYTPASTFKIFNSLVGLETGVIPDDQFVIRWDSVKRQREECNQDLTMRQAFKESCVNYYQELARRVGKADLQHYLDTVKYGNMNMNGPVDMFWLNDTLRISADEQLGFVKRLYFDELPFSQRSQRIVRSMMLREESAGYKLYYKTGTANLKGKDLLWVVGFVEQIVSVKEPENSMNKSNQRIYPYFFALNMESPDQDPKWRTTRIDILHEVLKDFGISDSTKR
jgi:hypothetical protein